MAKHRQNGTPKESPPATHKDDPLLSMSEVARQIGKSPQTIAAWCRDGLLEHSRLPTGVPAVRQSQVNGILRVSQLDVKSVYAESENGKKKE